MPRKSWPKKPPELSSRRNPKGIIRNRPELRRHDCRHTNACLEEIVHQPWVGMSCAECTAYVQITPMEHRRDLDGLTSMLQRVFEDDWGPRDREHRADEYMNELAEFNRGIAESFAAEGKPVDFEFGGRKTFRFLRKKLCN